MPLAPGLAQLLAPQVAKRADELHRGIVLQNAGAPVSEAQGYGQLDQQRQVALAGDDMRVRALEAMGSRGTHGVIDKAQVGDTGVDRAARIDRLGNKQTWTGDDLTGVSDGEIAGARQLRKQRDAAGYDPNTIVTPGYLPRVGVSADKRRVEVDAVHLPLEGIKPRGDTFGYLGQRGVTPYAPGAPGVAIPKAMEARSAQQEGLTPADAAGVISEDLRKRFAYLSPSA